MRTIFITPFAEADIHQVIRYYNTFNPELATYFLQILDQSFKLISEKPLAFPIFYKKIRRFIVNGFPYSVFYMEEPKNIYIIAILHMKRGPKVTKKRLKK